MSTRENHLKRMGEMAEQRHRQTIRDSRVDCYGRKRRGPLKDSRASKKHYKDLDRKERRMKAEEEKRTATQGAGEVQIKEEDADPSETSMEVDKAAQTIQWGEVVGKLFDIKREALEEMNVKEVVHPSPRVMKEDAPEEAEEDYVPNYSKIQIDRLSALYTFF